MTISLRDSLKLEDFAGVWAFSRVIQTPDGAVTGRVEGTLTLRPGEGGLVAEEEGQMRLPGAAPMLTQRRSIWRTDGGRIEVLFGDGRPFHAFDPGQQRPQAVHDCAPDRYEVVYDFSNFPVWTSIWRVNGPRKDYVMTTTHRRAG